MSYYILPKIHTKIKFEPKIELKNINPIISFSVIKYLDEVNIQLNKIKLQVDCDHDNLLSLVNPYEYIINKVPGCKYSVSKLKTESNIFYNFMEISNILNLFDIYEDQNIKCLIFSKNYNSIVDYIDLIREDKEDVKIIKREFKYEIDNRELMSMVDFSFYDVNIDYNNINLYTITLLKIICNIVLTLKKNGSTIIKIGDVFYKPIVDILYILCNLYEKVYIIKPNTINNLSSEKYLVCKKYIDNMSNNNYLFQNIEKMINFYNVIENIQKNDVITNGSNYGNINITSLINNEHQYYFINKLEEFNIITGQQQIECYDNIINIYKCRNRDEKMENLKKNNIQKCIQWCEKYKIPCNKFPELFNIFLPQNKKDINKNTNVIMNSNSNSNIEDIIIDNESIIDTLIDEKSEIIINDNIDIEPIVCLDENITDTDICISYDQFYCESCEERSATSNDD